MTWYEEDVKKVEVTRAKLTYEPKLVFYGSSSIRLWDSLYEDFKQYSPVNLGFGGSTLDACNYFFERILLPYHPKHLVFYAGDNDLGDGRSPEQVLAYFKLFLGKMEKNFPTTSLSFISIKPSLSRWDIIQNIRSTNQLIKTFIEKAGKEYYYVDIFDSMLDPSRLPIRDYYQEDELHLSKQGYEVWKNILLAHLQKFNDSIT